MLTYVMSLIISKPSGCFSKCFNLFVIDKISYTFAKDIKSMFVEVEKNNDWVIVYDKKTKVMYAVSDYSYGSGVFTELVDENGRPRLWEGKE